MERVEGLRRLLHLDKEYSISSVLSDIDCSSRYGSTA